MKRKVPTISRDYYKSLIIMGNLSQSNPVFHVSLGEVHCGVPPPPTVIKHFLFGYIILVVTSGVFPPKPYLGYLGVRFARCNPDDSPKKRYLLDGLDEICWLLLGGGRVLTGFDGICMILIMNIYDTNCCIMDAIWYYDIIHNMIWYQCL